MSMQNIKKSKFIRLLIATAMGALLAGCTKDNQKSNSTSPNDTSGNQAHESVSGGELNLAIWSNYLSPEMAKKFSQQTGIKLNISNYSSNEDLLAKIQSGASGIDVAVPSDYMVSILLKQGQLQELNAAMIPNLTGVSKDLLDRDYDKGNKFSIPYSWTITGIAVNRELYKGRIESWKDVLENEQLRGKISLMDDVREATGMALKIDGISVNSVDEKELKKAKEYLLKIKKNIKLFQSDAIDLLTHKEVVVAQSYSSDALNAWNRTNGKIEFILPKEGTIRAIDNLVILKSSKKLEAAHKLINFLISEEANVNFVSTMFGGPVLTNTRAKLEERLRSQEALFPKTESLQKLEGLHDVGEKTSLYEDLWTAVKTAN